DEAKERGVSAEVIDLRSLWPFDEKTVITSIEKTGRAVVVHESPRTCSIGSEIAARAMDHNFLNLKAPVTRVTGFDIPVPMARYEDYNMPDVFKIMKAIEHVMSF
ncbi:MAG: alpha-ketoacid dehydrogenase subunit beta, partial [Candidatus Aenigmarchaeota archaeon]|nr:alpha-ketoacid dehydrogenase subunit beta [Candidatus Aenigmarchaeota archaeon]